MARIDKLDLLEAYLLGWRRGQREAVEKPGEETFPRTINEARSVCEQIAARSEADGGEG